MAPRKCGNQSFPEWKFRPRRSAPGAPAGVKKWGNSGICEVGIWNLMSRIHVSVSLQWCCHTPSRIFQPRLFNHCLIISLLYSFVPVFRCLHFIIVFSSSLWVITFFKLILPLVALCFFRYKNEDILFVLSFPPPLFLITSQPSVTMPWPGLEYERVTGALRNSWEMGFDAVHYALNVPHNYNIRHLGSNPSLLLMYFSYRVLQLRQQWHIKVNSVPAPKFFGKSIVVGGS